MITEIIKICICMYKNYTKCIPKQFKTESKNGRFIFTRKRFAY